LEDVVQKLQPEHVSQVVTDFDPNASCGAPIEIVILLKNDVLSFVNSFSFQIWITAFELPLE